MLTRSKHKAASTEGRHGRQRVTRNLFKCLPKPKIVPPTGIIPTGATRQLRKTKAIKLETILECDPVTVTPRKQPDNKAAVPGQMALTPNLSKHFSRLDLIKSAPVGPGKQHSPSETDNDTISQLSSFELPEYVCWPTKKAQETVNQPAPYEYDSGASTVSGGFSDQLKLTFGAARQPQSVVTLSSVSNDLQETNDENARDGFFDNIPDLPSPEQLVYKRSFEHLRTPQSPQRIHRTPDHPNPIEIPESQETPPTAAANEVNVPEPEAEGSPTRERGRRRRHESSSEDSKDKIEFNICTKAHKVTIVCPDTASSDGSSSNELSVRIQMRGRRKKEKINMQIVRGRKRPR